MDIILANDEKILKSWDYSKSGHALDSHKTHKSLTVTNKRIIATEESTFTLRHEEIPLNCAKGVTGYYRKNDGLWMRFKRVLAWIWCCTIIGMVLGGIKAVKSLTQQINSCVFYLNITTVNLEGSSFSVGAMPDTGLSQRKQAFSNSINKMKVFVDKELGKEIVREMGAIIHNNGLPLKKDAESSEE